jgi:hypothetical protein
MDDPVDLEPQESDVCNTARVRLFTVSTHTAWSEHAPELAHYPIHVMDVINAVFDDEEVAPLTFTW